MRVDTPVWILLALASVILSTPISAQENGAEEEEDSPRTIADITAESDRFDGLFTLFRDRESGEPLGLCCGARCVSKECGRSENSNRMRAFPMRPVTILLLMLPLLTPGTVLAQGRYEHAVNIGVATDERARFRCKYVDGSHRAGCLAQLIRFLEGDPLVGHCDVGTVEPTVAQFADSRVKAIELHFTYCVVTVDASCSQRGSVHHRRQRVLRRQSE